MKAFRIDVRKRGFLRNFFFCLLAFFLLLFPKGGFKMGDTPITWGYLLMGVFALAFALRRRFVIHPSRLRCFLLLIPFQALSLLSLAINGMGNSGFTISFLISFLFIPILFFLLLSDAIESLSLSLFLIYLRRALFFLAAFGIFLFFYRLLIGKWIQIPFLTVNFHDFGKLDEKNIGRGGALFKLFSTYNNGNIYGICMLMLLPLYNLCENSPWRKGIVKLSIILTLSRTVWLGLFFTELLNDFLVRRSNRWIKYKFLVFCGVFASIIFFIIYQFNFDIAFLLDKTLGNRIDQLKYLVTANLFSSDLFDGIMEIVYLGILKNFGWMGLLAFLIAMIGPVGIHFLQNHKITKTPFEKALYAALFSYLFVSLGDGAILFIPTMVFYWFLSSLLQRKEFNYSIPGRRSVSISPRSIKYSKFSLTN